jgi:iron complex outermembrane receptor protein
VTVSASANVLRNLTTPGARVTTAMGLLIGLTIEPVLAQGLEEVIVTAQRRSQSLQDVGVAVTAISSDAARSLGVFNAKDLSKVAPGVLIDSVAGGSASVNLTIRGVSQSDFSANQESPNSMYIDEIYIASSAAAAVPLYDLDRVEVLRGPQGTLFGRASSGGLVQFIPKKPTDEFEAYIDVGYGDFDAAYLEGAIGGAISSSMRGRIAVRGSKSDGWYENELPGGEDTFEDRFFGTRVQLEVDLSDQLTARFSLGYDKSPEHNQGMYTPVSAYVDANGQPAIIPKDLDVYGTGPGNDFTGYRSPYGSEQKGQFNNVGRFENERITPSLYLTWEGDTFSVNSITNYTKFEFDYNEDCDGGPLDYCNFPSAQDLDQWSQELRISGTTDDLTWTTGLYYLSVDQDVEVAFSFPALSGSDFAFSDNNLVEQDLESYAVFGQVEYTLTETLSGTVGLRYTQDDKEFSSQVFFFELGNGYFGGTGTEVFDPPLLAYDFSTETVGSQAKASEDMWSGKVQLDYRPNEDSLLYAGVSLGAKGPGFNTNVSGNLTNPETPFDSEDLIAYEVGSKMELLDNSLRINTSLFYYDYTDFQGFAFNGLQGVVGNYDGYFKGGEIELTYAPTDSLQMGLGGSYIDSNLEDIPTTYDGVRDQQSILAPEWTANGYIRKAFRVGDGELSLQMSGDYVDDRYASVDNNRGTFVEGSFMYGARVAYYYDPQDIEIAVYVDNLGDTERQNFVFDLISTNGNLIQSYAKPRWWGISIKKSFN